MNVIARCPDGVAESPFLRPGYRAVSMPASARTDCAAFVSPDRRQLSLHPVAAAERIRPRAVIDPDKWMRIMFFQRQRSNNGLLILPTRTATKEFRVSRLRYYQGPARIARRPVLPMRLKLPAPRRLA